MSVCEFTPSCTQEVFILVDFVVRLTVTRAPIDVDSHFLDLIKV